MTSTKGEDEKATDGAGDRGGVEIVMQMQMMDKGGSQLGKKR